MNRDTAEIDKFAALAHQWWDENGELRTLHQLNPLRLAWIEQQAGKLADEAQSNVRDGIACAREQGEARVGQFSADDQAIVNTDNVVWLTTGTTHVARAEEWPIMPTEWVNVLLKPWNFFNETPTLGLVQSAKKSK